MFTLLLCHLGDEPEDADLDAPKIYEPIESLDQLSTKLKFYQDMYNETVRSGKMDLVFFKVSFEGQVYEPNNEENHVCYFNQIKTTIVR